MTYFKVLAILAALAGSQAMAAGTEDSSASADVSAYQSAEAAILGGDFAGALPILAELTQAEPDNADAWNLLGFASRKSGDLAAAEMAYGRALEINPDHLGALEYQGEMFLDMAKPEMAKANLARLQSLCGTCEEAVDLAEALAEAGV